MQGKNLTEYMLFSIPVDMLEEAGIDETSIIQMSAGRGKIYIEAVTDYDDYVCDYNCSDCPLQHDGCCAKEYDDCPRRNARYE